jgi:hypothetical protein
MRFIAASPPVTVHDSHSGFERDSMMFKRFCLAMLPLALLALTACDNKKAAPAQNAQPQGEQESFSKDKENKKVKGRSMPKPPPIEPATPPE